MSRPICRLSPESATSFWGMMSAVSETLKHAGMFTYAQHFRQQAMALAQDDEDLTDLLALVVRYVEVQ